jgi:hypothetical protein
MTYHTIIEKGHTIAEIVFFPAAFVDYEFTAVIFYVKLIFIPHALSMIAQSKSQLIPHF